MTIYTTLITLFWVVFIAVWLISSFSAKRNARFNPSGIVFRLVIIAVLLVLLRLGAFDSAQRPFLQTSSPIVAAIGVALCGVGVAFAIWARFYLGRNWGMPMSVKTDPELVTSGPYAYVRHPIYTGALLAMVGTALTDGIGWLILVVVLGAYFIYGATREEKLLAATFPDTYPAYKAHTKMLIPFIF